MSQSVPFEPQTNTVHVNRCPCSCVCSSYPSCPIYPPVCPPVMPKPMCITPALYNQSTESITVNEGAAVPLPNVVKVGNGLSYDPTTGMITVTTPGVYLFQWNVLAQAASATQGTPVVFALQNTAGTVYATSGNVNAGQEPAPTLVSGSTVLCLPADTTLALYNRSGATVTVTPAKGSTGAAFSAGLTAVKIQ